MKVWARYMLLFLFGFACAGQEEATNAADENNLNDGVLKILFIGNSHTYYNELPSTVEQLLNGKVTEEELLIRSATGGGMAFRDHADSESTQISIALENWDYVVLQENGGYASYPAEQAQAESYPFAKELKELIADNHPESKLLLYMTHAYKNGASWCDEDPNVCSYELMQNEIRRNYLYLENSLSAGIAPAGLMWWIIKDQIDLPLWNEDEFHPSAQGSFVSALTLATYFSQQEILTTDLPTALFTDSEKEIIVNSINQSLFQNMPDWRTY